MRKAVALVLLLPAGCVSVPRHADLAAARPLFSPAAFFSGKTEGRGELKEIFSSAKPVHVQGDGHVERDGSLVLDQTVDEQGKKPKRREWRIRETAPGRYAGTLTDAVGPVAGEVEGNRLHLAFRMKGGLTAEQWLYLQPGGRVALNRMAIRKLGFTVASLSETITKAG